MREQDPNNSAERKAEHRALRQRAQEGQVAAVAAAEEAEEKARISALMSAADIKAEDHVRRRESLAETTARNAEAEDVNRQRAGRARPVTDNRPDKTRATYPPFNPTKAAPLPPNKQLGSADLADKTIEELKALAAVHDVEAPRLDGKSGRPRKSDYVAALSS